MLKNRQLLRISVDSLDTLHNLKKLTYFDVLNDRTVSYKYDLKMGLEWLIYFYFKYWYFVTKYAFINYLLLTYKMGFAFA